MVRSRDRSSGGVCKTLYWIVKIFLYPLRFLPRRVELFKGKILGLILKACGFRTKIVRDNLELAYSGDIKKGKMSTADLLWLERQNYIHYGRLIFELLHIPFDALRFAKKNVKVEGYENIENALKKGKGVFLLSAHTGYWEIMSVMASLYNIPIHIVTKYLRISLFDKIWVKSRQSYGVKLINERNSAREILKTIKNNGAVGFVMDQFMGPPVGIRSSFFAKPAWTMASLAWFVSKTNAAVVPVFNFRNQDGSFTIQVGKELEFQRTGSSDGDIAYNTQLYNDVVESFIREYPDQWLWIHRRWKRVKEDDLQP